MLSVREPVSRERDNLTSFVTDTKPQRGVHGRVVDVDDCLGNGDQEQH
jgi:hypothetical protein